MCCLVHPVLADVHILLASSFGPTFAVGVEVEHPARADNAIQRYDLISRDAEHLVLKELTIWFMECFIGPDVGMTKGKPFVSEIGNDQRSPAVITIENICCLTKCTYISLSNTLTKLNRKCITIH